MGTRWALPPQNGMAIRTFRELQGITRSQLAERLEISESHLRNLETENRSAKRELISLLAAGLNVPVAAVTRYPATHAAHYNPPPFAADAEEVTDETATHA